MTKWSQVRAMYFKNLDSDPPQPLSEPTVASAFIFGLVRCELCIEYPSVRNRRDLMFMVVLPFMMNEEPMHPRKAKRHTAEYNPTSLSLTLSEDLSSLL